MRQNLPASRNGRLSAMNVAIHAAITHGATTPLAHNTAAKMTAIRSAAVTARDALEVGKETLRTLRDLLEAERTTTREFMMLGRDQLKPMLGRLYNPGWDVTGFDGSLEVPTRAADLETLVEAFHNYLAKNPEMEITVRDITSLKAAERYTAIKNARAAVALQEGAVETLTQERDARFQAVLITLRGLVKELAQLLSPLDGRWTAFGFNKPGAEERPETPTEIEVEVIEKNDISVKWEPTPRAKYYRVWVKVDGVDAAPRVVGTPSDPDFSIPALPLEAAIEIRVSAMNDGGESPLSEPTMVRIT